MSYTQFLWPTNALGARRATIDSTCSFSHLRTLSHRSLSLGRASSTQGSLDAGGLPGRARREAAGPVWVGPREQTGGRSLSVSSCRSE